MRERWPRLFAAGLIASSLFVPVSLSAQAHLALVEDASLPPKGFVRLRLISSWTRYDSRFTRTGTEPLGSFFTADSLGPREIPPLLTIQSAVEASSGAPFRLSVGRSTLNATAREVILPFALEYGVTNRLSVGVAVPVIQRRATIQFLLDSTGSNVGPNPALTSAAAEQLALQTQGEFGTAAAQLQARLQACQSNPGGPGCASINGREAQAQALITASTLFAGQLASLFGSATQAGMAFVPRTSSTAQALIVARIAAFNAQYVDFLTSPVPLLTTAPQGAGGGVGVDQFQQFLYQDLGRDSLRSQEHIGIGDVEIGAKFLVIDKQMTATRRRSLLVSVASSVQLPTGSRETRGEQIDLALGEGSLVVDSRVYVDGRIGRFGLLAAGEFAFKPNDEGFEPNLGVRSELLGSSTQMTQVYVAPRYYLSEPLSFHASYAFRSMDQFGGDQLIGGGVAFSTLASYRAGTTKAIPIEMRFTHLEAIAGDPGRPKFWRDQIELRLYYRLRR